MLNFRKLKHDVALGILKDGRALYEKDAISSARIVKLNPESVRMSCRVLGQFENSYTCELEIDRHDSTMIDSDCDCPYKYDCQHLAAVLFYLEEHFNAILLDYSHEAHPEKAIVDKKEKAKLRETIREAETKEVARRGKKYEKELIEEYVGSAQLLAQSPFFLKERELVEDKAELAIIAVAPTHGGEAKGFFEIQIALRLTSRSKPLHLLNVPQFLDAVRYQEFLYISGKRYFFSLRSFDNDSAHLLKTVLNHATGFDSKEERHQRSVQLSAEAFGTLLAQAHDLSMGRSHAVMALREEVEALALPCLYQGSMEEPIRYSRSPAVVRFEMESLDIPAPKLFLKPTFILDRVTAVPIDEALSFACANPGMLHKATYYRFSSRLTRKHIRHLPLIRDMTIPEPLIGTFVENALPELLHFAEVTNRSAVEQFVTLPYPSELKGECTLSYLDGELEASLFFLYGSIKVPASLAKLDGKDIKAFVKSEGILARNLTEEQKILDDLFQDFVYEPSEGVFVAKNDKKIIEFMTEVIPQNQKRVTFHCPENLLSQFVYDNTRFKLSLQETDKVDTYEVDLTVEGPLKGVTLDLLWDCLLSRRAFLEITHKKATKKKEETAIGKILILDLDKLAPVVQIFDEIGLIKLDDHKENRPLWSLASISAAQFEGLPIDFSMTPKLLEIQEQILGTRAIAPIAVPSTVQADLRNYQTDGIHWLHCLRRMHLNGILADEMGLGKTLQAIIAVTQYKLEHPKALALVICPTSLIYNWQEEFNKFSPKLKPLPVDGMPQQRKRLQTEIQQFDVIITSYTLLQKDIEFYKTLTFGYVILDEAQAIKNRFTRNAKSVKLLLSTHRLILTGTPLENSLEELWSLFDFLMPGLLSSYDRFVEKYIRSSKIDLLRRKVSPFILRRMKQDVLDDLPPVSNVVYHCHLSEVQLELYRSYANSAREELAQLVKKEGFDRVQIHVLATLTRLKQICCHPAIFAKDKPERGDSAKYEMLLELLQNLMEGGHKTVIFSQYTKMLHIMRDDLQQRGISFSYLDGSSKDRLSIVKQFNQDKTIPVFLVSLKAGGSGLNLVGADTVIHYDMWWNPAVENQATDRVHRIGQKSSVSSYKLITLNSIEEKILLLQNRKRGLFKKVVSSDEEAIAKLTWEEVLELLQV